VNEISFIGDRIALLALRIKQNLISAANKSLLELEYDLLKRELSTTPLLVPMAYSDDNEDAMPSDSAIHMTDRANFMLSALLYDKNSGPKNPIPSYLGIKDHTGQRLAVMWNGNRVIYYGGAEPIAADIAGKSAEETPGNTPKVMHCYFADNKHTGSHMLAAFTNIKDLRKMYGNRRIALFTFSELAALSKSGDGIVINPGQTGVSFEMDHQTIEKLI
ncbi:MAG: SseB family protein, partial [Oscillospiraceae bacterium]|nr:SseB family protein [Oscillospiraceae bacterium]